MFNNGGRSSRDAGTNTLPAAASHTNGKRGMFSVLGADVVITGNISATADLHIEGRVDGDVNCGALVQGGESRIAGSVRAETARLAGTVEGTVSVRTLVVERAARINGDVEYETISIENGASIDGRLKHITVESGKSFSGAQAALAAPAGRTTETVHLVSSSEAAA